MKKKKWTNSEIKEWIKDVLIIYKTEKRKGKEEAIKMLDYLYNNL